MVDDHGSVSILNLTTLQDACLTWLRLTWNKATGFWTSLCNMNFELNELVLKQDRKVMILLHVVYIFHCNSIKVALCQMLAYGYFHAL